MLTRTVARLRAWQPSADAVRLSQLGALVTNTVIVVTGGAVRLTASGLGCPTFPSCTDDSLVATREMGLHGVIEFGNRLLTFVLTASVLLALVTAWRAGRRDLVRPSALLVLGVAVQALLGGVTVLTGLNPVTVMAHFLVSMGLIAVATVAYERATHGRDPATPSRPSRRPPVRREIRLASWAMLTVVAATLVVGTVVTGAGPHSGDEDATDRLPFDLRMVSQLHADLVFLLIGLTVGLLVALTATDAPQRVVRRAAMLLAVELAQGTIGLVQYATDLPVALVAAHLLGACLVWITALRLVLAVRAPSDAATHEHASPGHRQQPGDPVMAHPA